VYTLVIAEVQICEFFLYQCVITSDAEQVIFFLGGGGAVLSFMTPNSCSESPGLDPHPDLGCRFFCAQIEAEA